MPHKIEIAAYRQAIAVLRLTIPIALVGIGGIQAQLGSRKTFISRYGIHLFTVRDGAPPKAAIQVLPHRHIIALRKAISRKRYLTVKFIKALGIAQPIGLAFLFAV
ncbi:hypothetical protein D3C80_1641630 [compost metagenome]